MPRATLDRGRDFVEQELVGPGDQLRRNVTFDDERLRPRQRLGGLTEGREHQQAPSNGAVYDQRERWQNRGHSWAGDAHGQILAGE